MKKIIMAATALVLCIGGAFSAASCGSKKECKHDVGAWETVTEATCSKEGSQKGTCGLCYKEVEEKIPVDAEAHVYGEWEILTTPTETEKGSARNVCTENTQHKIEIALPVLGSTDYRSSITTRPTASKDGVRTYTLKHDVGNVVFTQPVPSDGVQTIRDAVGLGASAESRALVREATGKTGYKKYDADVADPVATGSNFSHVYQFGDDTYTYIYEKDMGAEKEYKRWYFEEDGKVYGLTDRDGGGKIVNDLLDTSSSEKYLNGSRIYMTYYGGANEFGFSFGIEDFVDKLYRSARMSTNGDFAETVKTEGDKTVYSFSYGYVSNSGSDSGYFTVTKTAFTLTSAFTIESLKVEAVTYINNFAGGENIRSWAFDENKKAYVIGGKVDSATRYVDSVEFQQVLKADYTGEVPENPHSLEKMYAENFDVVYTGGKKGQTLTADGFLPSGERVKFASNHSTGDIFAIKNVTPEEALSTYTLEDFQIFLRTTENGKTVDKPITAHTMLSTGMTMYINKETMTFFLNAQQAGEQTVVVKTSGGVERLIQCEIGAAEPSNLNPTVYEYSAGRYNWVSTAGNIVKKNNSYTYQEFIFTAEVPADEKNYASNVHSVKITDSKGLVVVDTADETTVAIEYKDLPWFSFSNRGGKSVGVFAPEVAGTYNIEMISTLKKTIIAKIELTVTEAPSFADLVEKSYESINKLQYPIADVTLSFEDLQETATEYTVTAIVTAAGITEKLSCVYSKAERTLTSTHLSGDFIDRPENRPESGFTLSINDACDFIVSHVTEFDGEVDLVVMKEVVAAE